MKYYLLVGVLALAACAHSEVEKGLNDKLASEAPVKSTENLSTEADQLLARNPNLTDDQKMKLKTLWTAARKKSDEFLVDSRRLRSVLLKDVVSENFKPEEVDRIKDKISEIEHQRLSDFFTTVRETNRILGRWGSAEERERFYDMMDASSRYIRD